jgi:GT2 family glycosyltransferase
MRIAVVILNWNGKSFLEKFLPSVISNSQGATIYVADNASSDRSLEFVEKNFPTVIRIDNGNNFGFAGGYNKALEDLNEEFFVLLNSDVEITPNWLQPVIALFDSDQQVAAIQPKILSYHDKTSFEYAGAAGGFIDKNGYPFCRGRIFESLETDNGQYDAVQEVFWATGACMFVRSKVYRELGGLDDDFFAHMEEIDLCWRTKRAGHKIMVQPKSIVYHVGGGTLPKSNPFKTFLNFRNGLELLAKNLPKNRLFFGILTRLLWDTLAAFKFLASGSFKDFTAVIRAHIAFYVRLHKTLDKRCGNYNQVKGQYSGNIIIDFFLKRKKKFSDLSSDKF